MDTGLIAAALGAVVGAILALAGAGGGILAVPLLVFGLHLTIVQAAPVGLIAVGAVSAAAVQGAVEWPVALPFALGAVGALLAGRRVAARLAGRVLQRAFAVTSGAVALTMLARGLGFVV